MVSSDGNTLFAFGEGEFGQLGIGICSHKSTPTVVSQLSNKELKKVACGTQFSVALTKAGKVYIFGYCMFIFVYLLLRMFLLFVFCRMVKKA